MKTLNNNKGFTVIELAVVIVIVAVIFVILPTFFMGNFWYTQKGVLKKIQLNHPEVTEILDDSRNSWASSEFIVKEAGKRQTYYLDSNVLFNYEVHKK